PGAVGRPAAADRRCPRRALQSARAGLRQHPQGYVRVRPNPGPRSSRRGMHRRGLIPILLVLTGTLLGGLMLEAFLQAAALAVKVTHPSASRTWLPGHRRVLCLGDSNT